MRELLNRIKDKLFKYYDEECGYRRKCIEVSKNKGNLGLVLSLGGYFNNHVKFRIHLWWISIYITSHLKVNKDVNDIGAENYPEYGFCFTNFEGCEHLLFLYYGKYHKKKGKIIDMPWKLEHFRTTYYYKDGEEFFTEYSYPRFIRKIFKNNTLNIWHMRRDYIDHHPEQFHIVFDYKYTLKSGEVQVRKATCKIEEREWRLNWLWWSKLGNYVRRTLDIEFDKEVGEESGSWKGGVLGISCDLKEGETPEEAFRRFEREKKM